MWFARLRSSPICTYKIAALLLYLLLPREMFRTSKGKSNLVHCSQVRVRIDFQFSDFLDSSSFSTNPVPSLSFIFHSLLFVRTLIFLHIPNVYELGLYFYIFTHNSISFQISILDFPKTNPCN